MKKEEGFKRREYAGMDDEEGGRKKGRWREGEA